MGKFQGMGVLQSSCRFFSLQFYDALKRRKEQLINKENKNKDLEPEFVLLVNVNTCKQTVGAQILPRSQRLIGRNPTERPRCEICFSHYSDHGNYFYYSPVTKRVGTWDRNSPHCCQFFFEGRLIFNN